MTTRGTIECVIEGSVATVLIDRAQKQNSLTPDMLAQLADAVTQVESSDECRLLQVRGAGEKSFCSGADLPAFAEQTRESTWQQWIPHGHRVFDRLAALPVPTIAVLRGSAFGGGLELALACDLRLASTSSFVGFPEVGLGTLPGWGGTHRLASTIGMARARQMILTGAPISASTALQWGLINECAEPEKIEELVSSYVELLLSKAPVAQGLAKAVLRAVGDTGHNDVLEGLAGALSATTKDLAEGISAFRGKRISEFEGR